MTHKTVAQLEEEILKLTVEREKFEQDAADMRSDALALPWALREVKRATERAEKAEERNRQAWTAFTTRSPQVLTEVSPPADTTLPKPVEEISHFPIVANNDVNTAGTLASVKTIPNPSGSLEDILGFPKEGR